MFRRLLRKNLENLVFGALGLGIIGGCIIQIPPQETSQSQNSSSETPSSPYVYNPPSNSEPPSSSIDNPLGLTPVNPKENEAMLYCIADTYAESMNPDTNFGNAVSLSTGKVNFGEGRDDYFHAFIKFDLSEIPYSAQIEEARLKLTTAFNNSAKKPTGTATIMLPNNSWSENSLDYINMPSTGEYVLARDITFETGETFEFDVESAVQKWVNGTTNCGFWIKTRNISDDGYSYASFYSRELSSDAGPRLYVHWK